MSDGSASTGAVASAHAMKAARTLSDVERLRGWPARFVPTAVYVIQSLYWAPTVPPRTVTSTPAAGLIVPLATAVQFAGMTSDPDVPLSAAADAVGRKVTVEPGAKTS